MKSAMLIWRDSQLLAVVFGVFLAGLPPGASAEPHRVLDLRNQTDVTGDYEIAFCTRPSPGIAGLPGDTFVAFGHTPPGKARVFRAVGHTTNTGTTRGVPSYGGRFPVSGYLAEEGYTAVREDCLVARVNESEHDRALATTRSVLSRLGIGDPDDPVLLAYSLGSNDCMDYMMGVTRGLHSPSIKIPSRDATEFPLPYILRFIEAT